ncbi:MAG: tRNA dimethylallyltransferase [Chroococcopsis gigantea SAG 12.99]|jgi:tRNA dimethylallyltransferase|nr:tRNA (adenosine(37)-N6)-dimethylallyltransferase MiaA [Chlorogloea purpurea SAG 13.99]MDV2999430.1 tRNA dimethylallyltransferase [Chroococcopsis gigantea SAG 12.99]
MTPRLIVICGATATGKSGLALKLSQNFHSVILSADSRQVYKGFDIGTAKPTLEERRLVPHYLIDICEPTETLTLAHYQELTQDLIRSFSGNIFLVGGTGLYIKSIVRGMKIPRVAPQIELRRQLQGFSQTERYQMLRQVDFAAAQKIHRNDETRTIRALEVYYVTGKPISAQQGEDPPSYPILQIGLGCDMDRLTERIAERTQLMFQQGFVAEVERLGKLYGPDLPLLKTLGYGEVKDYLRGEISLQEAQELTVLHTRQFAKRQNTWFRADPQIHWFDSDAGDLVGRVSATIEKFNDNYK